MSVCKPQEEISKVLKQTSSKNKQKMSKNWKLYFFVAYFCVLALKERNLNSAKAELQDLCLLFYNENIIKSITN